MLLVAPVQDEQAAPLDAGRQQARRASTSSRCAARTCPAITHVDYSARVQTVDRERHGLYRELLEAFDRKTGCPVIINTSFNVGWEPIVCTPQRGLRHVHGVATSTCSAWATTC